MKLLKLTACSILFCVITFAADTSDKVDEFVAAEMKAQQIPGVSLAVVKDGKPVLVEGYGLANVEHQVAVKPETIFQSGSVGKQFTAMAVMMLVEKGKIGLDDPITKYFPDGPEAWKKIKVRNLLSHTSGIPDYETAHLIDLHKEYSEADLLKFAETLKLDFPPGEKWKYSNTGYVLLGIIIHKASGQFYGDFLHERVFVPLGMTTARIISDRDIVPNRAQGYELVKGELKNQDWVAASLNTTADGSLYLTSLDMIKWDAALRERKLLKPASYDQMWTSMMLNNGKPAGYGFGWFVSKKDGKLFVDHTGSWQGFKSFIGRWEGDGVTVIVFANLDKADPKKIGQGVAKLYVQQDAIK
jgi:CubicO group peptidase (beta-lactamase class C family)